jgi:GNAT superfamily N-acetyltransferase
MELSIKELQPALWKDLETLFGEKGACGGCWCMYWRALRGEKWEDVQGLEAKKRFKRMIQNGLGRGLIAYAGGEPVGWYTFSKRTDFPRLNRARSLTCADASEVCCVPCFYVKAAYRRKGVSTELLRAAIQLLTSEGETNIEGYPVKPAASGKSIPGAFAWTGTVPLFVKQGFELVGSPLTATLRYRKSLQPKR